MPITAAATTMSRMAIHSRPMWLRTRFLAIHANSTRMARHSRYFASGVLMGRPKTLKPDTETEPDDELLVNQDTRRNVQSLDGIPLTEPDGQGRLDLVELGTAERVEVVRGPVSALYGGAAGGGAVNLISRTGADQPGWMVRLLAGQFGTQRGELQWGGADGDRDLLVAAGYTGLEGYRDVSQGTNRRVRVLARAGNPAERRWTLDLAWSLLDQRIDRKSVV